MEYEKGYFESDTHWIAIISPEGLTEKDKKLLSNMMKNAKPITDFSKIPTPFSQLVPLEKFFSLAYEPKKKKTTK